VDPYRSTHSTHPTHAHVARTRGGGRDLVVPFAMLWLVSLFRLVVALVSGRAFGTLDTVAALALVLLPWALARGRVRMR
jgi:hypothetical protein